MGEVEGDREGLEGREGERKRRDAKKLICFLSDFSSNSVWGTSHRTSTMFY